MKYRISVFMCVVAISIMIFNSGCGSEKEFVVEYFPVEVGNWWQHEYRFFVVEYDTVTNDTFELLYTDSLRDEIAGTNVLSDWHCYRFFETLNNSTRWYAHPDSALLFIAALIDTSRLVIEGSSKDRIYMLNGTTLRTVYELASYIRYINSGLSWSHDADTMYMIPPQKFYVYPMSIGTNWIRMTDPFYEEREVIAAESVTVVAGSFQALKVCVTIDMGIDYDRYLWVNEEGTLKDSIYSRGIATNAIGDTIGYFDAYTTYELIAYDLE
ncbi:MAG: hypothetical protein JSV53_06885 [candidate division WOR-3 bacterium]|nr:MAG: hypothetical protein JSV53_06885 [candidate division WOR-3 bacterium]